jgi:2-polyprenyl-3-methyl-5-hydroxy-6-metoxy-1,4-benzoquinol methylase
MTLTDSKRAHDETREAWNANADYWDSYMGHEGNDFVNLLIWPPTVRLLALQPGQRVLDVACGNGLYATRLAALGAQVVALDFAEGMVRKARGRTQEHAKAIDYRVVDATDEEALLRLGIGQYDAAICQMALMDMAEIEPLMQSMSQLLRPRGRFVFSITHPCFNQPGATAMAELVEHDGKQQLVYSVKVTSYRTPRMFHAEALRDQPESQVHFHRPLQDVLSAGLAAGLVLDALEERTFPKDHPPGRHPLGWSGHFSEIPPVLMGRFRR